MKIENVVIHYFFWSICFLGTGCCKQDFRSQTNNELLAIEIAVSTYLIESKANLQLPQLPEELILHPYEVLKNYRLGTNTISYLPENPRWDKAGKIVDCWGQDYKIEVLVTNSSKNIKYYLKISSGGPNQIIETPSGDDIVRIFEL